MRKRKKERKKERKKITNSSKKKKNLTFMVSFSASLASFCVISSASS